MIACRCAPFLLLCVGQATGFLALQHITTSHPKIESNTVLGLWSQLDKVMDTFVIKTFFPTTDEKNNDTVLQVDPTKVLATFDLVQCTDSSLLILAHTSLINYLQLWGKQLELQPDKGLRTPITATDFRNTSQAYTYWDATLSDQNPILPKEVCTIPSNVSMTLKFRPPKRYLSYKEQKSMEKGVLPDRKGAKMDAWSPGGIQLFVEIVEKTNTTGPWQLRLEARRCDIDGDTVIKYSSERAIIRRLQEAIRIWIKVRAMT